MQAQAAAPLAVEPIRRPRAASLRRFAAANPVALTAASLILAAAIATGSLWGQDVSAWGAGPLTTLTGGRWWTALTALIVPGSTIDAVLSIGLALTMLAYAERRLGSRRLLAILLGVGVGGLLLAVAMHAASLTISDLGEFSAAETPVADPSIAIVGATLAASAFSSSLWRRRLRLVGLATLAMFALYAGNAADWYRLAAAGAGLLVGIGIGPRTAIGGYRSSARATRSLVASLVAVAGLGPIAALVAGGGRGPFSAVVDMFVQLDQRLAERCIAHHVPACDHATMLLVTRGTGPALLALVPLVLLVIAALGLRQGRRSAWVLAIAVQTAIGALAVAQLLTGEVDIDPWVDGTGLEYLMWGIASIGMPAAIVLLLVRTRARFPVRAAAGRGRISAAIMAVAFAASAAVILGIGSTQRAAFNVAPSPLDLVVVAIRAFVPPAFLGGLGQPPYPRHGIALSAYQWSGVAFWAVVVVATLLLYRSTARPAGQDGARFGALLRTGGGTLGHLGTWPGNDYWYAADEGAAIAYRLVGDVALAIADPVGPAEAREPAIRGFVEHCIARGWTPVFYSIHGDALAALRAMGWSHLSVGEETVMRLPGLTLDGKAWQKVRQPFVRAEREGVQAVWARWAELSAWQIAQIDEINDQWVADRALPELGFTLGTIEEIKDPEVALLLAVDSSGRIIAITSWMPVWRDGVRIGWTLDFMRRRSDAPNGVMEYLIASAALRMRDQGLELLSLSGAPLAVAPDSEPARPTLLARLLGWLAAVLEPAYGFASLFRFKSKFHPEYHRLYLAYGDPIDLPQIGLAVARAYLSPTPGRAAIALLRSLRRSAR